MNLYAALHRRHGPPPDPITRRDFLRITLATGSALLLAPGLLDAADTSSKPHGTKKRFLILGAGLAGLSCAHELHMAGYDVTVLDSRNRLGGRVQTLTDFIPGKNIEAGGEFIGANHPLWNAYAKKFGLQLVNAENDSSHNSSPIILDGEVLTFNQEKELWQEMSFALNLMNRDATRAVVDAPWKTKNAAKLDQRPTLEWLLSLNLSDRCRTAVRAQLENDNGVSLERQSYLANLTMVKGGGLDRFWTDSESLRCVGGNQQLARKLSDSIGRQRIHLKTTARLIDLAGHGVRVTTTENQVFEADEIIFTLPPSLWHTIRITPEFPAALRPQMGTALKYLSHVKEPFWKKTNQKATSLSDGPIGWTWDATAHQNNHQNPCLTAFSGGPAADKIHDVPSEERKNFYTDELSTPYPGYEKNLVATQYLDWSANANTRGGYSFPAPGQITALGPLLHKPFANKLHFAGEYTCYKFVGYMEGALQSGVAVARRLVHPS